MGAKFLEKTLVTTNDSEMNNVNSNLQETALPVCTENVLHLSENKECLKAQKINKGKGNKAPLRTTVLFSASSQSDEKPEMSLSLSIVFTIMDVVFQSSVRNNNYISTPITPLYLSLCCFTVCSCRGNHNNAN